MAHKKSQGWSSSLEIGLEVRVGAGGLVGGRGPGVGLHRAAPGADRHDDRPAGELGDGDRELALDLAQRRRVGVCGVPDVRGFPGLRGVPSVCGVSSVCRVLDLCSVCGV